MSYSRILALRKRNNQLRANSCAGSLRSAEDRLMLEKLAHSACQARDTREKGMKLRREKGGARGEKQNSESLRTFNLKQLFTAKDAKDAKENKRPALSSRSPIR